ncbi:hypothetical protein ZIOFF_006946 [Zingiber officinale]|uniref:Cystatin domain-containing protein n=1 Tax=Zingiber officinale TaxID=94328 RepID=A0A8J5ICT6_ZINOF|nr:hypothetical protein ZIOFF_006946 [Zingiber officinale]
MRTLSFLVFFFFFISSQVFASANSVNRLGGWKTIVDTQDPNVQKVAKFAVSEYAKQQGQSFELVDVVAAQRQVVAGFNYRLLLEAKASTGKVSKYGVLVDESLKGDLKLVAFEPVRPSASTNDKTKEGRWETIINPQDPEARKVAEFAVSEYGKQQGASFELVDIFAARRNVVAGLIKYQLVLDVRTPSKSVSRTANPRASPGLSIKWHRPTPFLPPFPTDQMAVDQAATKPAGGDPPAVKGSETSVSPSPSPATRYSSRYLHFWPPSQRTRDAVIHRLINILSTPSSLSKRYGVVPQEEASSTVRLIEEEAFGAASAAGGGLVASVDDEEEVLQIYSKEVGDRMIKFVKERAASGSSLSADGEGASSIPAPGDSSHSDANAVTEASSLKSESPQA